MLTIRKEQIEAFQHLMRVQFVERLLRHLRNEMPTPTADMTDTDLSATIRLAIARANGYGIGAEWDLCRFAMYEVRLGAGFESRPENGWATDVLEQPGLGGTAKMDGLDRCHFALSRLSS